MDDKQISVFQNALTSNNSISGSLLPKLLEGLTPEELNKLRMQALEGQLGIELERMKMQDRLLASEAEIDAFVSTVARMDRQTQSPLASYKVSRSTQGASGQTTITARKGACFVATVVYEDADHPDVRLLRTFRHSVLETFPHGRDFSAWYYRNGYNISRTQMGRGFLAHIVRFCLSVFCVGLRLSGLLRKR